MDLNHVAVFIDNLEETALAPAFGGWGGPAVTISEQPATVSGRATTHSGRTRRLRTAAEPVFGVSVEDVAPNAPIQPEPGNSWHHLAIWCQDIPAAVAALEAQGYERDVVGRGAEGELVTFAYMKSSHGPRLELADAAMRQRMTEYFKQMTAQTPGPGADTAPSAPFAPVEVATVVASAAELDRLRTAWEDALGAKWGDVVEDVVTVSTRDGERELRLRSVSTVSEPRVTILAPAAGSADLFAPVAHGWHYVGFRSHDLAGDIAWFERSGLELEFCKRDDEGRPQAFAMLRTPDGTRVKLVGSLPAKDAGEGSIVK